MLEHICNFNTELEDYWYCACGKRVDLTFKKIHEKKQVVPVIHKSSMEYIHEKVLAAESHLVVELARLETKIENNNKETDRIIMALNDGLVCFYEQHENRIDKLESAYNRQGELLLINRDTNINTRERLSEIEKLEEQHVISWGGLTDKVKKLTDDNYQLEQRVMQQDRVIETAIGDIETDVMYIKQTVSQLCDKIAEIANYCYRDE